MLLGKEYLYDQWVAVGGVAAYSQAGVFEGGELFRIAKDVFPREGISFEQVLEDASRIVRLADDRQ